MRWLSRAFGGNARAPRDAESAVRSALLAVLDGDLDRAEDLLTAAARLDSRSPEVFRALARVHGLRGERGRAIRIHQNLLLRSDLPDRDRVATLARLAADYRDGGFSQRAMASYEELLRRDPRHREALRGLVALLCESGEHERAVKLARRLARLEGRRPGPAEAAILVLMSEAAREAGRAKDARRAAKRAIRRDKTCARAWLALAAAEHDHQHAPAAIRAIERALAADPACAPDAVPALEWVCAESGRSADLARILARVVERHPEERQLRLAFARHRARSGDAEGGIGELRSLVDRAPNDLLARAALGQLLVAEGRDAEARAAFIELVGRMESQPAEAEAGA